MKILYYDFYENLVLRFLMSRFLIKILYYDFLWKSYTTIFYITISYSMIFLWKSYTTIFYITISYITFSYENLLSFFYFDENTRYDIVFFDIMEN